MAEKQLANRHALVTGAGSGIGAAVATALVAEGARVTLAGRRHEPLEELARTLGKDHARPVSGFDVIDADAIKTGMATVRAGFGPVDILINNAGAAPSAPFERMDLAFWNHVIATDLTSVFLVTQAALSDIKAHGKDGRIVNVASVAGLMGFAYVSAYCAAKHGVVGLTRALAQELAESGATVNAVCPCYVDTPMLRRAAAGVAKTTGRTEAEVLAHFASANPHKRLITPEEVAEAVIRLALPAQSAVNGAAIAIPANDEDAP
jgi:NAD(P)-dependent dehydrogenase (short-subunit alcohol dehydrogenase family)